MALIDHTGEIRNAWWRVGEDGAIPVQDDAILPFRRILERLQNNEARGRIGLHISNDTAAEDVEALFPRLALISIEFPSFGDGRGFSLARKLRLMGFTGELRAYGPLIADQLADAQSCGFDTVEIPEAVATRQPGEQWSLAAGVIRTSYQPTYTGRRSILAARHALRG